MFPVDSDTAHAKKRSEPRVRTQALPVKISGGCKRLYGYSRDLSSSGMQVRVFSLCPDWPKQVGERIDLDFRVPEMEISLQCKAEIIWNCVPHTGHEKMVLQGMKFIDLPPEIKNQLKSWTKETI